MKRFKVFLLTLVILLFSGFGLTGCTQETETGAEGTERLTIPDEVWEAVAAADSVWGSAEEDPPGDFGYQELTLIEDDEEPEEALPEETPGAGKAERKEDKKQSSIDEDGIYDSKDEVALYIHTYGRLPQNYITKKEAQALGWSGGPLSDYAPGKCIGGSYFGNYEKALPEKKGRKYYECDIDTLGASKRGAKRIIYSNDGLIYYTADHYGTFELLYPQKE